MTFLRMYRISPVKKPINIGISLKIIGLLTGVFFFIELIFGIISGSLALQADALHMASDFISIMIGIYSQKCAILPPDNKNTFGLVRYDIIGGFANGIFLISSCFFIILESIHKFIELHNGEPLVNNISLLLMVGIIGLGINIMGIIILHFCTDEETLSNSHNMRGVLLHIIGDLLGSIGVIASALIMDNWEAMGGDPSSPYKYISDPISSFIIVILILGTVRNLIKDSLNILLEGVPKSIDINEITEKLLNVEEVINIHDLHIWNLNNSMILSSCHVEYINKDKNSMMNTQDTIKKILCDYKIYKSTIQFEHCLEDCDHTSQNSHKTCHDIVKYEGI